MYAAILLAAGRSERMGFPKGLVQWKGKPLITHQIEQIQKSNIEDLFVVLGEHASMYLSVITPDPNLNFICNENWEQGKSSSIHKGLTGLSAQHQAVLFVNIDQPLNHHVINELVTSYERNQQAIQIPVFEGRRGHPILISLRLSQALKNVSEDSAGLKGVIRAFPEEICELVVKDESILYNFNTKLDFERRSKH